MKAIWRRPVTLVIALSMVLGTGEVSAAIFGLTNTSELYSSTNGGGTWSVLSTLPAGDAVGLAAGRYTNDLYMITRSGSVYHSTNGGIAWSEVGALTASDLVGFTINPDGSILILTESGALYRSTNGGATFSALATLTASNFVSLIRGPLGRHYALTATGEVYESQNQGTAWSAVGGVVVSNAVSIHRKSAELFVMTRTGEVFRSLNYGRDWIPVGAIAASNMMSIVENASVLLAAAETGEIYSSLNGVSWSPVGCINQFKVVSLGADTPLATGVQVDETLPAFTVRAPFPNPTNRAVGSTFTFTLASPDCIDLMAFDARGRLVGAVRFGPFNSPGLHEVRWRPEGLAAGNYFVRLTTRSKQVSTVKWSLVE